MNIHIHRKDYGSGICLEHCQFSLNKGDRYGLIGPNGSGKSTLLRIMAGLDLDYSGAVQVESGTRVAFVSQEADFPPHLEVLDWLCAGAYKLRSDIRDLEEAMASPLESQALEKILLKYQHCLDEYEAMGGVDAEDQALRFLERSGLYHRAFAPLSVLSGGEQSRLRLGRALDGRPDVLLLDEPGNHLDFAGLANLEEKLDQFRGTLLMVSHDRRLLEKTCTQTLVLENRRITCFGASYGSWRIERIQQAASQGMAWQADRKKVERLEELVRRFREFARNTADPAWGKRLRARETHLAQAKASATDKPNLDKNRLGLNFQADAGPSHTALEIKGYDTSRGGRILYHVPYCFMASGDRVALIGANGSGKTSLIKDILAEAHWDNKELRLGPSQRLACLAQTREGFEPAQTMVDHFLLLSPSRREDIISFLKPFRFGAQDMDKELGQLSGGQWNLFQLARAIRLEANFLILDEPTNHLDLDARESLEDALQDFRGTILAVSHDRWFLDAVCTRVWDIRKGELVDTGLSPAEYFSLVDHDLEGKPEPGEKDALKALRGGDYESARKLGKNLAKEAGRQKHRP